MMARPLVAAVIVSPAMSIRYAAPIISLLALSSAPALAADPPPAATARLEYDVPAQGCPPATILRDEFARRLGYDFVVEDAPLRVVAKIAREKGALASSLSLYDSAGKQRWTKPATFPAWQCLTLVQAMAGLLAVQFDPLVFRAAALEVPPPPPPAPPPPPPSPSPPATEARTCPSSSFRHRARLLLPSVPFGSSAASMGLSRPTSLRVPPRALLCGPGLISPICRFPSNLVCA